MANIVIAAEGPNAEKAAAVAAEFFRREFGVEAETQVLKSGEAQRSGIDPAWLAVILMIPTAIIDAIDLAKRVKLIERAEAMLAEMRRLLGGAGGAIRVGGTKIFDIASAKAKDIVDALRGESGRE
jgi:hypothetical protein